MILFTKHAFVCLNEIVNFIPFVQYKDIKLSFKSPLPHSRNVSENFVCLCRQTLSPIHTIFSTVYSISDLNIIHKFQDNSRIFTRVRECTEGQTNKQKNRMHKHYSTLFENIKYRYKTFSTVSHVQYLDK